MAYKVIILYRLYMPSYVLGTFTEYPYKRISAESITPVVPDGFCAYFISEKAV